MNREHFRGVVWPREPFDGPQGKIYRYVVVGMLVTDRPLDVEPNQTAIDGSVTGLALALEQAHRVGLPRILGDAVDVLLALDEAWPEVEPRP